MTVPFDRRQGLVIVGAEVRGPSDRVRVRLLVDTGAAFSMLRPSILVAAGYNLSRPRSVVRIAAVSGILEAPLFIGGDVRAIDHEWQEIAVLSYPLPAGLPFAGLLGANFFRGRLLSIDYRAGEISLE